MIGHTLLADGLITLPGGTVTASSTSGTSTAFIRVDTTPNVYGDETSTGASPVFTNTVPTQPCGVASTGYVKATTGGFTSGSAVGSWLALSSARAWSVARSALGSLTDTVTLQFSGDSAGSLITSQITVVLTATITSP